MNILRGRRHLCTPTPGIGSLADAERGHLHDGQRPTQQGYGPNRPPGRVLEADPVHWFLHERLSETLLEDIADSHLPSRLQSEVHRFPISWSQMVHTLDYLLETSDISDEHAAEITKERLTEIGLPL